VATEYSANATGHEGLAVAQRIADATSQLRLAAATGYTQAIEDELRQRYRAIRHNLRNPLGTIKTAVALLTDENVPVETRVSPRVRAMVVRNTRSLDQMIGEALGDAAARLRAFDTSPDTPADLPADSSTEWAISGPKQRDNVARSRQRPNLESGAF
jgi:K+-sensing histidine kinase KdpD